ncbi:MAG: dockerin type I domain-containing protein [Acidobacteriota bacterium]
MRVSGAGRLGVAGLLAATVLGWPGSPPRAGGALLVNGQGEALAWDASRPLTFNLDQGPLGQLTQAEAADLVTQSFGIWQAVPTASVRFEAGPPLPCDVTAALLVSGADFNLCGPPGEQVMIFGTADDGISPVVFDTDGSILDALFGFQAGNSLIGITLLVGGTFQPPVLTDAEIIINGRFFDGNTTNPEAVSREAFQAVIVHEFGHWLNLDHSQLNLPFWLDGDPVNDRFLPTMFPSSGDDDAQLLTLNPDDTASLTALYPSAPAVQATARLSGSVQDSAGQPVQGGNLVLRSVDDPLGDVFSTVSGARFFPAPPLAGVTPEEFGGPPPPELEGAYLFEGIPPGAYTLEVEEIEPIFTDASSVGPLNVPVFLPGADEFWNGVNESSDPMVDDPRESRLLTLAAGENRSGVDLLLNALSPPALLYAVDDEPFDPNQPLGPLAIIELDLGSGRILHRIPAPESVSFIAHGLAFAPPRGTLFFTDGQGSGTIFEIDRDTGMILNGFPWPTGTSRVDGLAFLGGAGQPTGGRLYALDSVAEQILALDPDTGVLDAQHTLTFGGADLFGSLAGSGDELFVPAGDFILHLRPAAADPLFNVVSKPNLRQIDPGQFSPGLDGFLLGLGFDGESLYATSISPPFLVWRLNVFPATSTGAAGLPRRLDVLSAVPDPTPAVPFGGFTGADTALRGDLDGSLRVDGFDLAALARVFGTGSGAAEFLAAADLDRDGSVDGGDLAILAAFFGRGLVTP